MNRTASSRKRSAAPKGKRSSSRRPTSVADESVSNGWSHQDIEIEGDLERLAFAAGDERLVMLTRPKATLGIPPSFIQVWRADDRRPERTIKLAAAARPIECLAVSPDGRYVVSGYQTLQVWDVRSGRLIKQLKGHQGYKTNVRDVRFSFDGKYVASASHDRTAHLWRLPSGRHLSTVTHEYWVETVAFSSSGDRLFTGCISYSSPPKVFGGLQGFELDGSEPVEYKLPYEVAPAWNSLAVSPDGRLLIGAIGMPKPGDAFGVWNAKDGKFLHMIPAGKYGVGTQVLFAPDGERLLAAQQKRIVLWNTKTWKKGGEIDGHSRFAVTAAGRYIAFQSKAQIKVRELESAVS
jgi:WD40 repeat protein